LINVGIPAAAAFFGAAALVSSLLGVGALFADDEQGDERYEKNFKIAKAAFAIAAVSLFLHLLIPNAEQMKAIANPCSIEANNE
jgi:hypothetical protein